MWRRIRPGGLLRTLPLVVAAFLPGAGCQPPAENGAAAGAHEVKMVVLKGPRGDTLALVPVYIEGKGPFAFALDTGASHSTVDARVAAELGLPAGPVGEEVKGVGGKALARPVGVRQWRVAECDLPASTLDAVDLSAGDRQDGLQGLLGSDILSRFHVVTVDYKGERLVFNPGASGRLEARP